MIDPVAISADELAALRVRVAEADRFRDLWLREEAKLANARRVDRQERERLRGELVSSLLADAKAVADGLDDVDGFVAGPVGEGLRLVRAQLRGVVDRPCGGDGPLPRP